jgi:GT2 family glycosyltransferase
VIGFPHAFNFSAINNKAVRHAQGEIVGLINNDIEVITPDWLTEMVSWAQLDRIGCVGAKLMYPNELVQHGGVLLGVGGVANHAHRNKHRNDPSYFGRAVVLQNLSAVTAACLLVRKSVYQEVGGLDEQDLTVAFNDVDFCLKVRDAGYDNVWTPFAELYHHESPSRGTEDTPEKQARFAREVAVMQERWGDQLLADPYYSRNLTLDREDFSLAFPPRVAKPWKIRNKLWGRKRERT